MALRSSLLKMGIAATSLAIVALTLTSIWPFPSGQFKVDLPSPSEIQWSYANGVVHVTAPYSVDNGGYYDVDELSIYYRITNMTNAPITEHRTPAISLPAGQITHSTIDFNLDILDLYSRNITWMVFHDDTLNFYVEVSCFYTMKLVKFFATYQVYVIWDPLIKSWDVDLPTPWPPTSNEVTVPYWLNTSRLLSGLPPASATFTLLGIDSSGTRTAISTTTAAIQLGTDYNGTVTMTLPLVPVLYARYELVYSATVADFGIPPTIIDVPGWTP